MITRFNEIFQSQNVVIQNGFFKVEYRDKTKSRLDKNIQILKSRNVEVLKTSNNYAKEYLGTFEI